MGIPFATTETRYVIERIASPVAGEEWESVYRLDKDAMPTQSHFWAKAVTASGRFVDVSRLYEFADGLRAVLPLFGRRIAHAIVVSRQSPPPAWGFGGLISSQPIAAGHISAILEDLRRQPAAFTQIRPNPIQAPIWQRATSHGWSKVSRCSHVLYLEGGWETVWSKRFTQGARRQVRRGLRSELEIECGSTVELINDFYYLLGLSIKRWGRRQREPIAVARLRGHLRDPRSKFLSMASAAGESLRFWVARLGTNPVAAILVLQDGVAHYTRGAMDEALAGQTGANYVLHRMAIEQACKAGCTHYHMGETGNSVSLAQFKTRFGAVPIEYPEYVFDRLPLRWIDRTVRRIAKRAVGFRDV